MNAALSTNSHVWKLINVSCTQAHAGLCHPHCYINTPTSDTLMYPNVPLYQRCKLITLHPSRRCMSCRVMQFSICSKNILVKSHRVSKILYECSTSYLPQSFNFSRNEPSFQLNYITNNKLIFGNVRLDGVQDNSN